MPPAAISRSSTNLPKICGNIALAYGSALTALPLLSCAPEPLPGRDLALSLHELPGCRAPRPLEDVGVELEALGDFPASNLTTEAVAANAAGRRLHFPGRTRAVSALTTSQGGPRFWGIGERRGDVLDVLLWPEETPCELFSDPDSSGTQDPYLPGGQALGVSHEHGIVLAVGRDSPIPAVGVGALVFDLALGTAARVDMPLPRADATVTQFGDGLLVAGGRDPESQELWKQFVVFRPEERDFVAGTELFRPRSRHAAVLLATGETLLVGGARDTGEALSMLEAISPASLTTRADLDGLLHPRISPYAFTLSDGRIFIGGGELSDGRPVSQLEWLTADASGHAPPGVIEVDPRLHRAFSPLPGGAVLGVGGCAPEPIGCAGTANDGIWVTPEGVVHSFPLDVPAPRPLLVPASDGAPFLVTDGRLFRFDPWLRRFDPIAFPPELLPPADGPRPLTVDAGALVWFAEVAGQGVLMGMRHDVRNRFSRDVVLLADPLRPAHLAPDRPAPDDGVRFDGRLELSHGAVHVTDTDYEDVAIELVVHAGPPPIVLLGGAELGGALCPWPEADVVEPDIAGVVRRGTEATLTRGGESRSCAVAPGRTGVGLRGRGAQSSVVSQLTIRR